MMRGQVKPSFKREQKQMEVIVVKISLIKIVFKNLQPANGNQMI